MESRIRELEADTSQLDTLRHTAQLFTQLQVRTRGGGGEVPYQGAGGGHQPAGHPQAHSPALHSATGKDKREGGGGLESRIRELDAHIHVSKFIVFHRFHVSLGIIFTGGGRNCPKCDQRPGSFGFGAGRTHSPPPPAQERRVILYVQIHAHMLKGENIENTDSLFVTQLCWLFL